MTKPAIDWIEKVVRVDSLQPHERNPRTISTTDYKRLVESLRKFGLFKPILATHEGKIIGGHQRIKALKQLKWQFRPNFLE